MHIRPAAVTDLQQILRLNLNLFIFEHQYTDSYSLAWTYSPVGEHFFYNRVTKPNGIVLVAEDTNHIIVGYICGYVYRFTARKTNIMAEIENMYINPESRRQSVGKKLIQAFCAKAKVLGGKRVKVGALAANSNAHSFYRSHGFREHEIIFEMELTDDQE